MFITPEMITALNMYITISATLLYLSGIFFVIAVLYSFTNINGNKKQTYRNIAMFIISILLFISWMPMDS